MGDTPKWIKKMVRARMAETGNKYTYCLREIQAELKEKDENADRDHGPEH